MGKSSFELNIGGEARPNDHMILVDHRSLASSLSLNCPSSAILSISLDLFNHLISHCTSGTRHLAWLCIFNPALFLDCDHKLLAMFRWITGFFGLEPIQHPTSTDSPVSRPFFEFTLEEKNWPEGSQIRRRLRSHEPDGWAHSNWSWRSNGYIDHPGSLHPKPGKAECRHCLGVLKCQGCGKILRPCTKSADMRAQLDRPCSDSTCGDVLIWVTCEARSYRFVINEDGSQYSIWEHTGSHCSHPRPPPGRQPPRSVPMPPHISRTKTNKGGERSQTSTRTVRADTPVVRERPRKAHVPAVPALDAAAAGSSVESVDDMPVVAERPRKKTRPRKAPVPTLPTLGAPAAGSSVESIDVMPSAPKEQTGMLPCAGCGEPSNSCDSPGLACEGAVAWRDERYVCLLLVFHVAQLIGLSIGQYALFRTADGGKRYPAKIVSRNGRRVTLAWHLHNVYSPGEGPTSPTFSCSAKECMDALDDAALNVLRRSSVSSFTNYKELTHLSLATE